MSKLGSGDNGEFTFLDTLSILSFAIALENLDANLTQNDKQELMEELNAKTDRLLNEIHNHLQEQDKKLDSIIEVMKNVGIF
jgi:hypothetical protein